MNKVKFINGDLFNPFNQISLELKPYVQLNIAPTIIREFERLLVLHKDNMEILFKLKREWLEEDGNLDEWLEFYKRDVQRLKELECVLNYCKKENKNYLHEFLKEKGEKEHESN